MGTFSILRTDNLSNYGNRSVPELDGIVNKPLFEVGPYIREGRLRIVMAATPPTPVQLAALYPHRKLQDPKVRLLLDFMAERCQRLIKETLAGR